MIFFGPLALLFPFFFVIIIMRLGTSLLFDQGRQRGSFDPRRALFPEYYEKLGSTDSQSLVFQTAHKLGGSLTVSDVVIELGIGIEEAERVLGAMVDNSRVRVDVSEHGLLVYDFPEVRARLEANRDTQHNQQQDSDSRRDR